MSSAQLLAENLVRLVTVALISFWVARYLGPSQFGILNFASALMAILLAVSALGMDTPVILRLTQGRERGALMGTVLLVRGGAGLLVWAVAVAIAFVLKRDDAIALTATSIVSLCLVAEVPTVLDYWFKARTAATAPALARTGSTLLSAAAKVACLLLGLGVVALAWTVALEALLAGLFLVFAYLSSSAGSRRDVLSVDRRLIRPLLGECRPYMVSAVATVALMKIDVVMLGYLSSNAETGIYSLAQKFSEVLYIVPVVLIESAYPALAGRFLESGSRDGTHGQMLFDLAVGGALIATVAAIPLAQALIATVFGAGYGRAADIFYLHAWSAVAIAMNLARLRWLAVLGLQRYVPVVTVSGLAANVAMNFVLIPRLGAMGAAIATVVSYFACGYLFSFLLAPLQEIGRMQTRALWPWGRLYESASLWHAKRCAT
jgi:PST family polysaccharide transporter